MKIFNINTILALLSMGLIFIFPYIVIEKIEYDKNHPCLEYKTYCYYRQSSSGTGMTTKGSMVMTSSSQKIYIDCDDKDFIPKTIYTEEKCEKRK